MTKEEIKEIKEFTDKTTQIIEQVCKQHSAAAFVTTVKQMIQDSTGVVWPTVAALPGITKDQKRKILFAWAEALSKVMAAVARYLPERTTVLHENSSNVGSSRYSDLSCILAVTFKSGEVYQYLDVPAELYEEMLAAPSVGKFLNDRIKGKYQFKRVKKGNAG